MMNRSPPLLLALLLALLLVGPALQAQETVLHAGRMIDVLEGSVRENVTILIDGNRIIDVRDGYTSIAPGQKSVDLREHTVMPGLMDMHVHITEQLGPHSETDKFTMGPADWALQAAEFAKRTLHAGFTTIRELGEGEPGVVSALKNAINKGRVEGPRIHAAGQSITTTGGYGDPTRGTRRELARQAGPEQGIFDGPDEARKAVRLQYKNGADLIKIRVTGGLLTPDSQRDLRMFSVEELAAIVATARDYNLPVTAHAHGATGIKDALRAGVDSIEHGTYMDEEAIRLMKQNNIYLIPTLTPSRWLAENIGRDGLFVNLSQDRMNMLIDQIRTTFASARKAGVKIAFGTDVGIFPHGDNAVEFQYMVEYGMPPLEAIRSATIEAARLLRVSDRLGAIQAGMLADLIAVRGDPLQDMALMLRPAFVMKDGVIYRKD